MLILHRAKNKAIGLADVFVPFGYTLGDFCPLLRRDEQKQNTEVIALATPHNPQDPLIDTRKLTDGLNLLNVAVNNECMHQNPQDRQRFLSQAVCQIVMSLKDRQVLRNVFELLDEEAKFEALRVLLVDSELAQDFQKDRQSHESRRQVALKDRPVETLVAEGVDECITVLIAVYHSILDPLWAMLVQIDQKYGLLDRVVRLVLSVAMFWLTILLEVISTIERRGRVAKKRKKLM